MVASIELMQPASSNDTPHKADNRRIRPLCFKKETEAVQAEPK
jgi:hypothetical protein